MDTVHGTTVAIEGAGVLLRGPSGSGKSDLALRLIDSGGILIADDRCVLALEDGRVIARAPATLRGRLEVRGLGIMTIPFHERAALVLVVDLAGLVVERLPEAEFTDLLGIPVRCLRLAAFEASTPAKIRMALRAIRQLVYGWDHG
jgi:serine kinase of HPr protein (carbohydrate metabolism regulator)